MLISVAEFKTYAGLTGSSEDTFIETLIKAAGGFMAEYLGRVIEETEIVERFNGDDIGSMIFLSNFPVTTFTWLKYRKGTYTDEQMTDFDDDDFEVDKDEGVVYVDNMYPGRRNIEAYYKAGYTTVNMPEAMKLACKKLVGNFYNGRRSDGFKSEEVAGSRIEWDKLMNDDIKSLLSPYLKIKI